MLRRIIGTAFRHSSIPERCALCIPLINNGSCTKTDFSTSSKNEADKKLFTPGPLGVSRTTKEAMLRDLGSRDIEFVETVKLVRHELLSLAEISNNDFGAILLQGSGTYGIEATLQTTMPVTNGKLLILSNGAYGKRMDAICHRTKLAKHHINFDETQQVDLNVVETHLKTNPVYSAVAVVHCETSTGIVNDIDSLGKLVKKHCPGATYIVDAMSSFGAIPINFESSCIDYLITSANKCLEGVPGFAIVIARLRHLRTCKGQSRSLSLDLLDQYQGLEDSGQFRFTPPTHAILAFQQALLELRKEGGIPGRARRYQANCETIRQGMQKFGFERLIPDKINGYIITSYLLPKDPNFTFEKFYNGLNILSQVIYPGKVTEQDTFRIGNIGHLFPNDMIELLLCVERVCRDMGVSVPLSH